jgi:hypothetical protein
VRFGVAPEEPAKCADFRITGGRLDRERSGHQQRVERRASAAPPAVLDERHVLLATDPPPRRRRSALLGGGVLIAASPAAVGAGLFVPGFAALGLGALLLLLPPRPRREHGRAASWRVIRRTWAAARRCAIASARWVAHTIARPSRAMARFARTSGRDGAVRIGRATAAGAAAIASAAAVAGSRGWAAAQVWAPRAWRGSSAAAQLVGREARSATVRSWARILPLLRRAEALFVAGTERAATEIGVYASSASRRLSAYVQSRVRPR